MNFKIANAPCSWGIEDASNPDNPSWESVLDEASQAGYKGIELGPFGYLPQNIDTLQNALQKRNLQIVAGTLYDDLVSPKNFDKLISKTHITCELISKVPNASKIEGQAYAAPYFVIIDQVNPIRSPFAGHPDIAPRLSKNEWDTMIKHIKEISKITWEQYGIRSVVHPHAGGYIEYSDEITQFLNDVPYETTGLCLDTGHLYYACMDPVEWLTKCSNRLDYIHFKDINQKVYKDVINRQIGFFEACKENVMCPIGKGIINYETIQKTLVENDYKGWVTLEQERDPKNATTSLDDVSTSLQYLTKIGY